MKRLMLLLVFPAVLLLWWAAARKESIPVVHFAVAKKETIQSIVSTNGKAEPVDFAAARAEIAGVVQSVLVERGQDVKQGQTLVVLDNVTERASLDTARAQLEQAKVDAAVSRQGGKESQLTDFEDRLRSAQFAVSEAERNLSALQRLYANHAATHEEVLAGEATLARAKLQVQAIENSKKTLVTTSDVNISAAKLRDAQAALALANHRLELTIIKAPIAGNVYQFDIRKGAYLELGALVAMIGNLDTMRVRVYVDEPDLGRVSQGLPVQITWEARPGQKWTGRVTQIPTEIVALGTRQVGVVACTIENPSHELLPGTNVDVAIISQVARDVVSIPKQALRSNSGRSGVFKLQGDHVSWQPVVAGVNSVTSVEMKSGLQLGDHVALPSEATLRNGARVKAVREAVSQQ
jgi:HlyD family secretion protein